MTTVAHPKLNAPDLGNSPSTSEIITLHLRDAIVAGHFAEDEPIRQDDIARQFNVSKIPVREALKRLEAEGLVMFQRNRGAMVTRISDAELAQELVAAKKELFNLRFQNATNQLDNTARIKEVRRNIARIQTVITQNAKAAE